MRKPSLRFVLSAGALVIVTIGLLCVYAFRRSDTSSEWTRSLREAAAGADRLLVCEGSFRGPKASKQPDCEIRDAAKIRDMLNLVEIDVSGSGFHCMCGGDYLLERTHGVGNRRGLQPGREIHRLNGLGQDGEDLGDCYRETARFV
jgi:hypothetical protein